MSSKLRILELNIHESGVSYYRHHLPLLALRERGHTVRAHDDARSTWSSVSDGGHERWLEEQFEAGVDVIHAGWTNNLTHLELAVAARERYKVPLIIDYDDDVLNVDKFNVNYKHYHEGAFSRRVARLGMRVADAVTVSTAPLEEALRVECRRTHVLPNLTYPPHWQGLPRDPRRDDDHSVRMMFAGGQSHLGDVNLLRDAVEWAMRHYDGREGRPHLKLIFVTCMPDWAAQWMESPRDPYANRVYYMQTGGEVATWQRVIRWVAPDILVAPLIHNRFNTSKSLIKAYDAAMVEGCAFACEAMETYEEVPTAGAYKVDSTREGAWQSALKELVENADMRRELSTHLRAWVLDSRTIGAYIHLWEAAYEHALRVPIVASLTDVVRPRILGPNGQLARDEGE